jgi:dual specificity phosphatase 3
MTQPEPENTNQQPTTSPAAVALWRTPNPVGEHLVLSGDLHPDAQQAARQLRGWIDLGVTGIVDVRGEWSDGDLVAGLAPGLEYVHVGVDDHLGRQPGSWFDTGVAGARRIIADTGGRVMVHCHMGINRGPSMGLAVLLDLGWELLEALESIRAARPIAAIAYAGDALRWHQRRTGVTNPLAAFQRRELFDWQRDNEIDTAWVISRLRQAS